MLDNSALKKIIGIEKEIIARVPSKEILIITKIHSGRLTDFRDVVALSKGIDLNKINEIIQLKTIIGIYKKLKKD